MYDVKWFTGGADIADARKIRTEVFILEQGFQDEFDETDEIAEHLVLYDHGAPIATGRLFAEDGSYHLGRIAVQKDYRKKGIGRILMQKLEERVRELGGKQVTISAQIRAEGFYQCCGYRSEGETYFDEHYPHIRMVKEL